MSFSIIKPGLLDTIQDMGRYGFGNWGINAGGVMDRFAAQVGNLLVRNNRCEAVIEIHFPGPQILFEQNALVSITGADFSPALNDQAIPLWQPIVIRRNTILHFPQHKYGARCYLAIHGGLCIDKWLNSYSTNLKAGAGGWRGRKLEKETKVSFKENTIYFAGLLKEETDATILGWRACLKQAYSNPNEIFFVKGNEWDELTEDSKAAFTENSFTIHTSSDRMGYQLVGTEINRNNDTELVSSAVSFGSVQLLPNGQLIILMADHQTTGGYPRIAQIISSDLPKLAQLRPGEAVYFKPTNIERAEELFFMQENELNILQRACCDRFNKIIC